MPKKKPTRSRRRRLDAYYSASRATDYLLGTYPQVADGTVLDPTSGDGSMAYALRASLRFSSVRTNDIDPKSTADSHLDACDDRLYREVPDWVITNTPNAVGGDLAHKAIKHARRGVVLLLRLSFLEPCGPSHLHVKGQSCEEVQCMRNGRQWLEQLAPTKMLSMPPFRIPGHTRNDAVPMAWFLWLFGADRQLIPGGITIMRHAPKRQLEMFRLDGSRRGPARYDENSP